MKDKSQAGKTAMMGELFEGNELKALAHELPSPV
jgi:hypothetical protein